MAIRHQRSAISRQGSAVSTVRRADREVECAEEQWSARGSVRGSIGDWGSRIGDWGLKNGGTEGSRKAGGRWDRDRGDEDVAICRVVLREFGPVGFVLAVVGGAEPEVVAGGGEDPAQAAPLLLRVEVEEQGVQRPQAGPFGLGD